MEGGGRGFEFKLQGIFHDFGLGDLEDFFIFHERVILSWYVANRCVSMCDEVGDEVGGLGRQVGR